jgi:MFS family permease
VKQNDNETPASTSETTSISVPTSSTEAVPRKHDAYGALRFRDFRLLISGSFLAMFGQQMITIAIGWQLYDRTGSALVLGGVGLAQVIPVILLSLPAGDIVDRYDRKLVVVLSQITLLLAALGLATLSYFNGPLLLIYGCLTLMGCAQSFNQPANQVLISQVVAEEAYENATTWRSSISQLASVIGPAAGGFLIGIFNGATAVYIISASVFLLCAILLILIRVQRKTGRKLEKKTFESLAEGLRFLGQTQIMLAAITLDLFAVLLGGATTLLPIFAKSILHVGPFGLGWLQAADSIGAVCMALFLASKPPFTKAGPTLLIAVAGFGVATIVFGLSHWFWLSIIALFTLGACDNISVVIRSTLVLVRTPDEMRGRVSSVSSLFIGTSNQMGGFESGLAAQLFGPVMAVAGGGVGTIIVVLLIATMWPDIRRMGKLRPSTQAELTTEEQLLEQLP